MGKKKAKQSSEELRQPRLMKLKDAARYMSMSPGKLRVLVQAGELAVIRGDGNAPWLLDIRQLDKWIERNNTTL